MRRWSWRSERSASMIAPGPASQLEVEARSPGVTHTVSLTKDAGLVTVVRQQPERQDHEGAAEGVARVIARRSNPTEQRTACLGRWDHEDGAHHL